MTSVVHLKYEEVREAAKKAYLDGRLGAQRSPGFPDAGKGCFYRYPNGSCCAVGAALDDETAAKFDNCGSSSVPALVSRGDLVCDDMRRILELQMLHDNWATAPAGLASSVEERFARLVGVAS